MEKLVRANLLQLCRWSLLFIVGLGGIYLLWTIFTQASTPRGLFAMTLQDYRENLHLDPFSYQASQPQARLFDVSIKDARNTLTACKIDHWIAVGPTYKPYSDSSLYYLWECRQGNIVIRASEMWEPYMGISGVQFGACRKSNCPSYAKMFENPSLVITKRDYTGV